MNWRKFRNGKLWVSLLVLLALWAGMTPEVHAQIPAEKPVMENVFWNVVWGSAWGSTMGLAAAVIGSSDKSQPTNVRESVFNGATVGGLIGLGVGLYLVFQGITFDPSGSTLSQGMIGQNTPPPNRFGYLAEAPPFAFTTESGHPFRITGFVARVVHLRF